MATARGRAFVNPDSAPGKSRVTGLTKRSRPIGGSHGGFALGFVNPRRSPYNRSFTKGRSLDFREVIPWEDPRWDGYVEGHPAGKIYHTSAWCRIVAEIGRYRPRCVIAEHDGEIAGLLPAMEVRSWLTGRRLGSLPFSDTCPPIADTAKVADGLVGRMADLRTELGLSSYELRGAAISRGDDSPASLDRMGFGSQSHFNNYTIPLTTDTDAVRRTFSRKAVRQTINKSIKLGVTVTKADPRRHLDAFYSLYVLNRKQHGIPPQPVELFSSIFERLRQSADPALYIADSEGRPVAALIVIRHKGTCYAKYEGVDLNARRVLPVYPLFWKTIEDAALAGDHTYDFGRTAADNAGLNGFKSRWGTTQTVLTYYFQPPGDGVSVVKSSSLKYRLFTSAFKRMPPALSVYIGRRIFRHFG